MSAEEKADRIYSFEYISWGSSQRAFNKVPNYLRKLGVELEMGITTPLGALPVDQLINYNSTTGSSVSRELTCIISLVLILRLLPRYLIYIKEERRICKIPRNK